MVSIQKNRVCMSVICGALAVVALGVYGAAFIVMFSGMVSWEKEQMPGRELDAAVIEMQAVARDVGLRKVSGERNGLLHEELFYTTQPGLAEEFELEMADVFMSGLDIEVSTSDQSSIALVGLSVSPALAAEIVDRPLRRSTTWSLAFMAVFLLVTGSAIVVICVGIFLLD